MALSSSLESPEMLVERLRNARAATDRCDILDHVRSIVAAEDVAAGSPAAARATAVAQRQASFGKHLPYFLSLLAAPGAAEDEELIRAVLEVVTALVEVTPVEGDAGDGGVGGGGAGGSPARERSPSTVDADGGRHAAAAMANAEALLNDSEAIDTLLGLCSVELFWARLLVISLLTRLLYARPR